MTASFNVPDGVSFEELKKAMADAQPEPCTHESDCGCESDEEGLSQGQIMAAGDKALELAIELANDPMVHKYMACEIINNMVRWHTVMGEELRDNGQQGASTGWLRDAGKFQAIMNILLTIDVGVCDWMTE